jgi:hypothetical protein
MSTYLAHTRRTTPSSEAGVDYYCPIGTPIRAAGDGRVFERGGSLATPTGRFITIDLDDGRRVRYLHLSRYQANVDRGGRVTRGQIVGYSGASGYGSEYFGATGPSGIPANTGGPHVHTTLWAGHYYRFGRYPMEPTLDFEKYVDRGATASGGASPFPNPEPILMEEDMYSIHAPGRGLGALIGPKGVFTYRSQAEAEQGDILVGPGGVRNGNDAQYDYWVSLATNVSVSVPDDEAFLGKGQNDRPWTLFDIGYFKVLTEEEFANQPFSIRRLEGNDRQYDLWKSQAVGGQAASFPVAAGNLTALSDADVARLASAVADEQVRRMSNG